MKQSTLKSYPLKRLKITDIRKAVARECLIYNDTSKRRINDILALDISPTIWYYLFHVDNWNNSSGFID